MDRKNEAVFKKSHEDSSLTIRTSAVLSNFTRAIVVWADNLLQEQDPDPLIFKRTLLKIKRAAQFESDASLDAIQFSARAQAANVVAHRNLWLKHWKVDTLSMPNLSTEKNVRRLLFGEHTLEKVLIETKSYANHNQGK